MTLNLRVNPEVKKSAEKVLSQLGMPMSTAIDIYLKQISLTGVMPFSITLLKAPVSINADEISIQEIRSQLQEGLNDIETENVQEASSKNFRESLSMKKYKSSITFIEAIKTLINMIEALSQELEIKTQKLIDQMLNKWYSMLLSKLYDSIKLSRMV